MANPEHVEILKQGVEVWNEWREDNPLVTPHLIYAKLSKEDLRGANLNMTNLEGAKLSGAHLSHVKLAEVNLFKADLSGADLTGAHLIQTILSRANLTQACLKRTNLYETNLSGCELEKADFYLSAMKSVIFTDVDLSHAFGLDKVIHSGPSSIGLDTIYKSRGQIPEVFLRGCGVPENFITYMKSLTMNPIEFYSCFISYSHQDKSFARRLHDQLQARGIRCWLDEHNLLPGDDIYEQVDREIKLWDKVLLCCSEHSLCSWWVDNEVGTAFKKEQQLMKERKQKVLSLVPLNLDGYMFSDEWKSGKRQQITERLAADFTGWKTDNTKFEEQFERVVKALQTAGAREEAPVSRL